MADLHLVSVVLFDGGCGTWQRYLEIASGYVRARLRGLSHNLDGLEEWRKLPEKEAFIVKVAIRFDVLTSVTFRKRPLLMDVIKFLFQPGRSRLEELDIPISSSSSSSPYSSSSSSDHTLPPADTVRVQNLDKEKSSMLCLMRCQNKVVCALAETNALAEWEKEQKTLGRLSLKELVLRSMEIERELEVKHSNTIRILSDFQDDPVAYSRYLTADIFRASALLYSHSVVLDGHPHVVQIKLAVDEIMRWIKRVPKKPSKEVDKKVHRSVVRSSVFGFYITGALTDEVGYRKLILEYSLEEVGEHVGNVKNIADILQEIWRERNIASADGVPFIGGWCTTFVGMVFFPKISL